MEWKNIEEMNKGIFVLYTEMEFLLEIIIYIRCLVRYMILIWKPKALTNFSLQGSLDYFPDGAPELATMGMPQILYNDLMAVFKKQFSRCCIYSTLFKGLLGK